MLVTRRWLFGLMAAPLVVRASSLMTVKEITYSAYGINGLTGKMSSEHITSSCVAVRLPGFDTASLYRTGDDGLVLPIAPTHVAEVPAGVETVWPLGKPRLEA